MTVHYRLGLRVVDLFISGNARCCDFDISVKIFNVGFADSSFCGHRLLVASAFRGRAESATNKSADRQGLGSQKRNDSFDKDGDPSFGV